ncbi:Ig-like domain-containing protein [Brevibacillus fluminis]|uniref:Ig-like domain-containing protein n=1 Tax=Brevibacillus fluminis TaxID=511487 RepID=UPI003F88668C
MYLRTMRYLLIVALVVGMALPTAGFAQSVETTLEQPAANAEQPTEQPAAHTEEPQQALAPIIRVTDANQKEYKTGDTADTDVEVTISHTASFQYTVQADTADESSEGSSDEPVTVKLAGKADGLPHAYVITATDKANGELKSTFELTITKPAADEPAVVQPKPRKPRVKSQPQVQTQVNNAQVTFSAISGTGTIADGGKATDDVQITITPATAGLGYKYSVAAPDAQPDDPAELTGSTDQDVVNDGSKFTLKGKADGTAVKYVITVKGATPEVSSTFTVTIEQRQMTITSPQAGTTVQPGDSIVLNFDKPLKYWENKPDVITGTDVTTNFTPIASIKKQGDQTGITYTATWDGNAKITLKPNAALTYGAKYDVTVQEKKIRDANYRFNKAFTGTFTVDTQPGATFYPTHNATGVSPLIQPTVTFTKPVFLAGSKQPITSANAASLIDFNGGAFTASYSGQVITVTPTNPLINRQSYTLKLKAGVVVDANNNPNAEASAVFMVEDNAPPYATITPAHGATYVSNTAALRVKFSKKMYLAGNGFVELNSANVGSVNIFSLLDESNYPVATTRTYDVVNNELYITPVAPLAYSKTYRLQVNAGVLRDAAGNYNTAAYSQFTTTPDFFPPYLVFTPSTGTSGVQLNASVVIKFTEPVTLQTSALTDYVTIKDINANSLIAFRPAWDAFTQTLTLTPSAYLQPNKGYIVTVLPNLVRDVSGLGNQLSTSIFYTQYDLTPPTFTSVPLNGASNVAVNDTFYVTVSEPVKRSNGEELTNSNAGKVVYLYDSLNKAVATKVTWDAAANKFAITPTYPLRSGASYRLAIAAGELRDLGGNPNNLFYSDFRTVVQWGAPIISASIANGQTNVPLDGQLLIFFDKPVSYADGTALSNSNIAKLLTFRDERNVNVPFTASWDADNLRVTVTSKSKLQTSQKYTVAIDAGKVMDGLGNRNNAFGILFTTVSAADLPTVISAPVNGDYDIPVDTDINLQFNKPVRLADGSPITASAIESLISLKTSRRDSVAFQAEWSPSELVMTLVPKKRLSKNESYTLYLPANAFTDMSNNPVPAYIASFSTQYDANLPKIASVPMNDDTNVPVDKKIEVVFSEDVTLKSGAKPTATTLKRLVAVYDENFRTVAASYSWNSTTRTLTIKPTQLLRINTAYTISVGPDSVFNKSKKGNGGYIATFKTTATADPIKITTTPKNLATNVSIRDDLKVTFSDAVTLANGSTITSSNLTGLVQLLTVDGKSVPAKLTWDSSKRTITVDPKLYLEQKSYYTLYIPAGSFSNQAGAVNDELKVTFMTGK